MQLEEVWKGEFPKYWDISGWAEIHEDNLFSLTKTDGKRKLYVRNLVNSKISEFNTTANILLGFYKNSIILGRLQDARSHISLTNLYAFDYVNNEIKWKNKNNYLFEKYKIPVAENTSFINVGKDYINLDTGETTQSPLNTTPQKSISDDFKDRLNKNWYLGSINNTLYFYDRVNSIYMLNTKTGVEQRVDLEDLKIVSSKASGTFTERKYSFKDRTLFDAVINNEYIVWTNNENNLVIYSQTQNSSIVIQNTKTDLDLCLGSITNNYILLYGIKNSSEGSIFIIKLGDSNEKYSQ